jgi:hypothetical protein
MILHFLEDIEHRVARGDTQILLVYGSDDESCEGYTQCETRASQHDTYTCSISSYPFYFVKALKKWVKESGSPCSPCSAFDASVDIICILQ